MTTRGIRSGLALLLFAAASAARGQPTRDPEYTMEVALPAVRMSLADVATLLEKARGFLSASGSLKDRTTDTLTLSDGVRRFQLANDFSPTALKGAPNFSDEFSYSFIASAGPVTGVSIDLSDFRRRVSVKGPNQAQVEALAQLLQAEFQDHVTHAVWALLPSLKGQLQAESQGTPGATILAAALALETAVVVAGE
jgi:hypothetical protein